MRSLALPGFFRAVLTAAPALAQACPAAVPFGPDERLADLSARCGVTAGAILRANEVTNEAALRQAGAVAIPRAPAEADPGLLERARTAAENTAERAEGMATRAGEAAADYLSENNVGQDLLKLGQSAGLLAADDDTTAEPHLSAVALSAGRVRIAATGLPGNRMLTLGVVQGQGLMPLQEVTPEPDGTVLIEVVLPEAAPENSLVLALEDDGRRLATTALQRR